MCRIVTSRRAKQLWQTYRLTDTTPTLKQLRRPLQTHKLKETKLILKAYDDHQTKELTLLKQHIHLLTTASTKIRS